MITLSSLTATLTKTLADDADAKQALDTVLFHSSSRGGSSRDHLLNYCDEGRSAALDRKSDRWATAYARVATAIRAAFEPNPEPPKPTKTLASETAALAEGRASAGLRDADGHRYVSIRRYTVMSGRGGMPSIGYGAIVECLLTGEELARTRASSDWTDAGKKLARRRGFHCFATLTDGVSFAGHVRIVPDDTNRRLTLLSARYFAPPGVTRPARPRLLA